MAESVSCNCVSGFRWKIANIVSVNHLESDEFVSVEARWRLRVFIAGYDHNPAPITVSLHKVNPEKLTGRYSVRCFAEDNSMRPIKRRAFVLNNPDFATLNIWWISRNEIRDLQKDHLIGNTLAFFAVIVPDDSEGNEREKSIQTSVNADTVACLDNLSFDLRHLLDDGAYSDVTLECGELSFPAHKNILSARSEVFAAMLQSDMAESRTGVIQISDVDASVLDKFLHYVYSGKPPGLSMDITPKLYAAADKYSMEPLKKFCTKFIEENLTRDSACKILVFADANGYKDLKDSVTRFIVNVELLRDEAIWTRFLEEQPKLATELLHQVYTEKCVPNTHCSI